MSFVFRRYVFTVFPFAIEDRSVLQRTDNIRGGFMATLEKEDGVLFLLVFCPP